MPETVISANVQPGLFVVKLPGMQVEDDRFPIIVQKFAEVAKPSIGEKPEISTTCYWDVLAGKLNGRKRHLHKPVFELIRETGRVIETVTVMKRGRKHARIIDKAVGIQYIKGPV